MGHYANLYNLNDVALSQVLRRAKTKFTELLAPHFDRTGWYSLPHATTPKQLAEMVRATVSDPEPEPIKKVKLTRDQQREEHSKLMETVDEIMKREYPEIYNGYNRGDLRWEKYNRTALKIRKGLREAAAAEQAEIDSQKPPRKIAIDQQDPENAMLLLVLDTCNWKSFYPSSEGPGSVDDKIRKMLGMPADPNDYAHRWVDLIGFGLALGSFKLGGTEEDRKKIADYVTSIDIRDKEGLPLTKILNFLQENYSSDAYYSYN